MNAGLFTIHMREESGDGGDGAPLFRVPGCRGVAQRRRQRIGKDELAPEIGHDDHIGRSRIGVVTPEVDGVVLTLLSPALIGLPIGLGLRWCRAIGLADQLAASQLGINRLPGAPAKAFDQNAVAAIAEREVVFAA